MLLTQDDITNIAVEVAHRIVAKKPRSSMPFPCKEANDLAFIIDQTAQIEDLLSIQGMEQELRDLAILPIPSHIPPLAEVVVAFNNELTKIPNKLSLKESERLSDISEGLRAATNPFLISALARCIISNSFE